MGKSILMSRIRIVRNKTTNCMLIQWVSEIFSTVIIETGNQITERLVAERRLLLRVCGIQTSQRLVESILSVEEEHVEGLEELLQLMPLQ